MIADIWTVMGKEWREYLVGAGASGGSGRGVIAALLLIGITSILWPLQMGRDLFTSAAPIIVDGLLLPYIILQTVIADSFAGERSSTSWHRCLDRRRVKRSILSFWPNCCRSRLALATRLWIGARSGRRRGPSRRSCGSSKA